MVLQYAVGSPFIDRDNAHVQNPQIIVQTINAEEIRVSVSFSDTAVPSGPFEVLIKQRNAGGTVVNQVNTHDIPTLPIVLTIANAMSFVGSWSLEFELNNEPATDAAERIIVPITVTEGIIPPIDTTLLTYLALGGVALFGIVFFLTRRK